MCIKTVGFAWLYDYQGLDGNGEDDGLAYAYSGASFGRADASIFVVTISVVSMTSSKNALPGYIFIFYSPIFLFHPISSQPSNLSYSFTPSPLNLHPPLPNTKHKPLSRLLPRPGTYLPDLEPSPPHNLPPLPLLPLRLLDTHLRRKLDHLHPPHTQSCHI